MVDGSTLKGLFSLEAGRGDALMTEAIRAGARRLDCYDGYLVSFYGRHGFTETHREANYSADGPDVVYMSRSAYSTRSTDRVA